MGASQVEVYNLALGYVGTRPVTLPNEASLQARTCTRSWPASRREALGSSSWPFATAIETGVQISTSVYTPPSNWLYAFQYPPKALGVWKMYNPGNVNLFLDQPYYGAYASFIDVYKTQMRGENYREIFVKSINSKVLLCNIPQPLIEYTYDLEDTTLWSPTFVTAMALRLAADICVSLTGNSDKAEKLGKQFRLAVGEASRISGYGDNQNGQGNTGSVDARG